VVRTATRPGYPLSAWLSLGAKSAIITVTSDDPDGPVVKLVLTASTPCTLIASGKRVF
jgi:hypothetical protein